MKIVDEALENMLEFILANELETRYYGVPQELRDRWYHGELDSSETSVNLRLDWELATGALEDASLEDVVKLLMKQIQFDITDLVENGDQFSNDHLLKAFDGSKKRGQEVEDFQVISALMYRELKGKGTDRERFEYTLFVRPYIKWADTPLVSGSQKVEHDTPV